MYHTGEVVTTAKSHMWGVMRTSDGEITQLCKSRDRAREWKNSYLELGNKRGEFRIVRATQEVEDWEVTK